MFAHGELPEEAPDKEFIGTSLDDATEDLGLGNDDFDSLDIDSWN